jgi:hypothetical protein
MKTDKVLFYTQNGEVCYHEAYTEKEALRILKEQGYKLAFTGRHIFGERDIRVIIGINKDNDVSLEKRRENGLRYAKRLFIK